jgi:predicted dehydrogenase
MTIHRRSFIKASVIGTGMAVTAARAVTAGQPVDRVRIAQIGCGGQGQSLARRFHQNKHAEVVYVCDVDQSRREKTRSELGGKSQAISDFRRIIDDKSIHAVAIATPDHWHTPAALLAMEAGKHVYVEKPCSHNVMEGRLLIDSARRHNLHVQHGTHSRSINLIASAIAALRDNAIGQVLVAKAWNVQQRSEIGRAKPSQPPKNVDYDMWVGPAAYMPYQANRFHYNWHWWHNFGTGDTGNDGVHELDIARWGLGVTTHPSFVSAAGGKLAFDDDQQFPDTQFVAFDYPASDGTGGKRRQLIFEMRLWSRYGLESVDNGTAFYGTEGWMLLSKRGIVKVFDKKNKERQLKLPELRLDEHTVNFVETIRGNSKSLNAEIEVGHLSATLCHLANMSTRLGRSITFDPTNETIANDKDASALLGRSYRDSHWAKPI